MAFLQNWHTIGETLGKGGEGPSPPFPKVSPIVCQPLATSSVSPRLPLSSVLQRRFFLKIPCPLGISRWRLGADAAMPPANRQEEAACQEAVSVCSWLCRQLTREGYRRHSDVRGGAVTSPALVRSPAPAQPCTPAHFSLALLVFACVFVSLVVRVGLDLEPIAEY